MRAFLLVLCLSISMAGLTACKSVPAVEYTKDEAGRVSADLLKIRTAVVGEDLAPEKAFETYAPSAVKDGKLPILISADSTDEDLINSIKESGLQIRGVYDLPSDLHHITAYLTDPRQLDDLVSRSDIRQIVIDNPEATLHPNGRRPQPPPPNVPKMP
ncbi:hypothetical protein KQI84_07200 [bacterium]|nr:hypothetical protein [bacterium]